MEYKNGGKYGLDYQFIGSILKELRKKRGITQHELARKAAVTTDTISNLERDIDNDPHLSTTARLADIFDVSIDLFCGRDRYYYADKTTKRLIEYCEKGIFKKDIIEKTLHIYANQSTELEQKRLEIYRKIHIADEDTINSIYFLVCK